jgi:hypothetical protein
MPVLSRRKGGGGGHSGGGHSGGGHSGGSHSGDGGSGGGKGSANHGTPGSGKTSGKVGGHELKVSQVDGLPKGHDKVTTYGKGGGSPINEKSGPLKGWHVGGGTRNQVYGSRFVFTKCCIYELILNYLYSYHPITPVPNTLPWGFIPIVVLLEIQALEEQTIPYLVSAVPPPAPQPTTPIIPPHSTIIVCLRTSPDREARSSR